MRLKKTYILLILSASLTACGFISNKDKKVNMKTKEETVAEKTIDDYTDTYTITPKTDLPKFKELTATFEKQAHRFEIEKCQFKYNGQSFFMGDSPEKIIQIFGEPDGEKVLTVDKKSSSIEYKKFNLLFWFSEPREQLKGMSFRFRDFDGEKNGLFEIVKFRQIPYQLDMTLNQFMDLSDLTHDKLRRMYRVFFMFQKECPPSKTERIFTSIGSEAVYESEGGGHLTWTGDFNPNQSNIIESISVGLETLETFKK